jgi:amino acid adenylation domain-containing protein
MRTNSYPKKAVIAAHQKIKEKNYWLKKLSGISGKSCFPIIQQIGKEKLKEDKTTFETVKFSLSGEVFKALIKLSKKDDRTLHVILAAGVIVLLYRYIDSDDIIVGTPIYKQDIDIDIINTVLALRTRLGNGMTFKEVLLQVRNNLIEATENYSYPVEMLPADLGLQSSDKEFPIFDVALLLSNIHDRSYIRRVPTNILFSFSRLEGAIKAVIDYNPCLYTKAAVQTIGNHYQNLGWQVFSHVDIQLNAVEILSEEEKRQILFDFNDTRAEYFQDKALHALFTEEAARTPDGIAVVLEHQEVTYKWLNEQANRLAYLLRDRGVTRETLVAVLLKPSIDLIASILGILKAGGAYLPIPPGYPPARILLILDDNNVLFLVTDTTILTNHSFTDLMKFREIRVEPIRTASRPPAHFDGLPVPDRSLLDYEKYNRYIGHAMVKNTLSFQGTRGCPYNCSYCHRIWPRTHVVRSAENIFSELMLYYNMGIRRFSFIDDIFNLNIENSTTFFRMIVKNRLNVQLFFPNGLRGDILTKDYIDLMVEAGTVNIDLALETASPRLQKLICKNLNIDKLKENIDYICQKHPQVILDFNAMYGFPSETEEEAMMTMEFIKSVKWIHFPFVFILKIHPNTGIGKLALQYGISPKAIMRSMNYSYHDVPETLPFPKSFARHFQAKFLKEYFLLKERLLHVLPYQMKIATENELVQKYNNYLPTEINCFSDIIEQAGISREELGEVTFLPADYMAVPDLNQKIRKYFPLKKKHEEALRILFLDLSELFSTEEQQILHGEIVEPTGLLCVLTYLNKKFAQRVYGKVAKSRIDFDNYHQLKTLITGFNPHLIGIRTLSYYKDFFHRTVFMIRNWGVDIPIISGGPYATMDYPMMLQDVNVASAVLGEGELTIAELVEAMLGNHKKFPSEEQLKEIQGIAFIQDKEKLRLKQSSRHIIWLDKSSSGLQRYPGQNPENINQPEDLLYLISTSGSTGNPKSVMLEHRNLNNLVHFQFSRTGIDFGRVLQFASIGFDVSAQEIFSTLLYGGRLYLIPDSMKSDIFHLFDYISKNRINTLFLPPAFLRFIFSDPEYAAKFPGNVGDIVTAGEQLVITEPIRRYLRNNHVCLHNHYGPTETHVVTSLILEPGTQVPELPPIGKPITNTKAFILGKHQNILPVGTCGELSISGYNVGRGYCNRQELTREKFVDGLFDGGARLYRTGDVARWLPGGDIQFLGRVDQQVKIRGFRIELGEIEKRLQNYNEIKKAVVEVIAGKSGGTDDGNENYLCAYIVTETELDTAELRENLFPSLPDYMIPSKFVQLEQIPLTPNGKIDRKALARYEVLGSGGKFYPPRDEIEKKLAGIWSEVLGIGKNMVGIDADFFDLGGHSLKATMLVSKIHKHFNTRLTLAEMFNMTTVRELAEYIRTAAKDALVPIEPAESKEYYAQSSPQKRQYILHQLNPDIPNYNISDALLVEGKVDKDTFKRIFQRLIERHESFRTTFEMMNHEPVQKIHKSDDVKFVIQSHDLEEERCDGRVSRFMTPEALIENFIQPFDLSKAPLLRVSLIKVEVEKHILVIDMHHIIFDGVSLEIFIKEFLVLYAGKDLPPLRLQYKDYSEWQDSESQRKVIKKQEGFWLKELADGIPILKLPFDFARSEVRSFEGDNQRFELGEQEVGLIKEMAGRHDATVYMVMLAIFNVFISKITGQEDILIGVDADGRRHADLGQVIGMFVNTLVLRNYPKKEKTFSEFLKEVAKRTADAFENRDYPFENLVEKVLGGRDVNQNPLYDVMFSFYNSSDIPTMSESTSIKGYSPLTLRPYPYKMKTAMFDLMFHVIESEKNILCEFEYCKELFKKERIEKFTKYFKRLVANILKTPTAKLVEIEIISDKEKDMLLAKIRDKKGISAVKSRNFAEDNGQNRTVDFDF